MAPLRQALYSIAGFAMQAATVVSQFEKSARGELDEPRAAHSFVKLRVSGKISN